jgi:hypothetical protein
MGAIWIVIVLVIGLFVLLGLWRWNRARTPTVAVVPMCTILCEVMDGGPHGRVVVSDRDDPLAVNDFTPFRPMNPPLGDPNLPFAFGGEPFPDTLGISEAWLPFPGAPEVHRAQATLARNSGPVEPNFTGSAWNISVQASNGTWSLPFARGTANSGMEPDTFDAARVTVPQLMPVGVANLRMFACAGLRTEDGADRSTWLIEATAPNVARGPNGSSTPIQDLLHGDDRFVPNKPIPAQPLSPAGFGPATPPIPGVVGIGDRGPVRCALRQLGDDVATRQLHMLTIENGTLYHSLASDSGRRVSVGRCWPSARGRFRHHQQRSDRCPALMEQRLEDQRLLRGGIRRALPTASHDAFLVGLVAATSGRSPRRVRRRAQWLGLRVSGLGWRVP